MQEAKQEAMQEAKQELKQEARQEAKQEAMQEAKQKAMQEAMRSTRAGGRWAPVRVPFACYIDQKVQIWRQFAAASVLSACQGFSKFCGSKSLHPYMYFLSTSDT
ncbi:hypothetical protein ACFSR7_16810 [Cohnella sp. GCM10020058]|uniref:hypothetical protein n=1 Tax=Cohnella sp. GCM10020058 TaxID=3317330 RepID=UPI0036380802